MSRYATPTLLLLLLSCTGLEPYQERQIPGRGPGPSDDLVDTSDPGPGTEDPTDVPATPGGSTPTPTPTPGGSTPEPTPPPEPSGPAIGTGCTLAGVSSAIIDCAGECVDSEGLNNGECDDGTPDASGFPTADFDCVNFSNDFGDCTGSTPTPTGPAPGEACNGAGVVDCDGVCVNSNLLGDGVCHDGNAANLMCAGNNFDNGDCDNVSSPNPPSNAQQPEICFFNDGTQGILDCDGDFCVLPSIIGDGDCDDGGFLFWDDPDMDCAMFNDDGGDC